MSRLRVNKLTNKDNNGAPEFVHGVTVSGVATATKFKGDGSELTSVTTNFNILDSGVPSGTISSLNFGNGLSIDSTLNSVATISVDTSNLASLSGATFAGIVTGTADYNTFTANVTLANEGTSFRSIESSAGSASKYHFFGSANGTNVCHIATDGSATFAGGDAVINSYGQLVITRSDSNAYPSLTINSAGTTTNTIDLNGDGSATFAASVECNSELRVLRSGNRVNLGGSDTLAVFENNGNFAINWDGSASFDGTITAAGYSFSNLTEL